MKEGRCMLTSEVVVLVGDIVTVERANITNVDNISDGNRKETLS